MACLADDSGLEVDALAGAPGAYSARYAGDQASDRENVEKLLDALSGTPIGQRRARFVCEIAYIAADGSQIAARGVCEGQIAEAPKGNNGFGYDPIFIPDEIDDGRTMAELSVEEKTEISHRGKALRELSQKLTRQTECESVEHSAKQQLAVFDFDGTLLNGASPVRLVRRLLLRKILPVSISLKVLIWGMKYKMRQPVEQEQVRGYIFGALSKLDANDVHDLMVDLYHQELKPLIRQDGITEIEKARQAGKRIIFVSASFEPIINELAKDFGADFFISTEMELKGDYYTGKVKAIPPEGIYKLTHLRNKADELYGEGGWILDSAYGDNYYDAQILSAALHPVTVDPDMALRKLARSLKWPVLDWK
jgi:non-canonical purine NTP pyrophosphatase (RdgB/HAM1 family)